MNQQIYDMKLVPDNNEIDKRVYDYFILAPNIERRSREFLLKVKDLGIIHNTVVMDYANFHKEIDKDVEKTFYDDFQSISATIIHAADDRDAIRQLCKLDIKADSVVAVDITGFSIPNIFRIMEVLKNGFGIKQLDVYYTEPKFYIYESGYFDAYHKIIKERKCMPILGYYNSGENEKEILTIFLGFDGGLANQVYFKLGEEGREILQTLVVNGFPSYTAKLKDVSLFNNEDLINKIERENVLCAAANNPFETYNLLCSVLEKFKGTLINICTIGSKPMALGACLFALDHMDEVKVTYPFFEKTAFDIEEEAGKIWRYTFSL